MQGKCSKNGNGHSLVVVKMTIRSESGRCRAALKVKYRKTTKRTTTVSKHLNSVAH